jgi:hypothetical protein
LIDKKYGNGNLPPKKIVPNQPYSKQEIGKKELKDKNNN